MAVRVIRMPLLSSPFCADPKVANFVTPVTNVEEFTALFTKLTTQGPKHRLPFLLSKPWVKEMMPKVLEDQGCHEMLLQNSLVANEDFVRLLIGTVQQDQLQLFGKVLNGEQETMLHVLCKGTPQRLTGASRADILSLLLTVCPPETFDLEAPDLRGQTALHLAAQSGDIGLVQVLLEYGANPNAQEETTGWTPLHFAVAKAQSCFCYYQISNSINITMLPSSMVIIIATIINTQDM